MLETCKTHLSKGNEKGGTLSGPGRKENGGGSPTAFVHLTPFRWCCGVPHPGTDGCVGGLPLHSCWGIVRSGGICAANRVQPERLTPEKKKKLGQILSNGQVKGKLPHEGGGRSEGGGGTATACLGATR